MRKKRFQVGSVAVLFSVVVLCVAVFAVLTVLTASSDMRLSRQYGEHVRSQYACENLGQQWLGEIDGWIAGKNALPDGTEVNENSVQTEIIKETSVLNIRLTLSGAGYAIDRWSCTAQWQPDEGLKVWQGTGEQDDG